MSPSPALPNAARGDAVLHVNGQPRLLCLTLGALAQIETALQAQSLTALDERLNHLSAADLMVLLSALLSAAGPAISPQEVAAARIDPGEAAAAVALAFAGALA